MERNVQVCVQGGLGQYLYKNVKIDPCLREQKETPTELLYSEPLFVFRRGLWESLAKRAGFLEHAILARAGSFGP